MFAKRANVQGCLCVGPRLFCFAGIFVKFKCSCSSGRKEYFVPTHSQLVLSNDLVINKYESLQKSVFRKKFGRQWGGTEFL